MGIVVDRGEPLSGGVFLGRLVAGGKPIVDITLADSGYGALAYLVGRYFSAVPSSVAALEGKDHPFSAPLCLAPMGPVGMKQVLDGLHPVEITFLAYLDHCPVDLAYATRSVQKRYLA